MCKRGAAGLSPWLAQIAALILALADHGRDRLAAADLVRTARDRELLRRVVAAAAPGLRRDRCCCSGRRAPARQRRCWPSVGAAAIVWLLVPLVWNSQSSVVRVLGAPLVIVVGARRGGAARRSITSRSKSATAREVAIGSANRLCASLWGLRPVALQPKGIVFTFVDLGPRLITVTHHDAITGPYHRNGQQIADVMNAFRGSADQAHRADRQISFELSADLPEQLDHDDLHVGGAEGLLRAAAARAGAGVAAAGRRCPRIRRSGCGRSSAS